MLPGAEPFDLSGGSQAAAGVVLCHGFTGTPQSMRPWGEHLAAAGFDVICPLLPGHGTRWQDANATGWRDWLGAVTDALRRLAARHRPVFAMGLSMGGTLALRLAELHPELRGIVLVNPSLTTLRKDAKLLPVLARLTGSWTGIASDIRKQGSTEVAYSRTPLRAALSLRELWAVTRADLGRIHQPTLLFRSAVDHVVEPVNAELVRDGVAGPCTERLLPDSYHVATLDNDAETIFTGSVEFARALLAVPDAG